MTANRRLCRRQRTNLVATNALRDDMFANQLLIDQACSIPGHHAVGRRRPDRATPAVTARTPWGPAGSASRTHRRQNDRQKFRQKAVCHDATNLTQMRWNLAAELGVLRFLREPARSPKQCLYRCENNA